MNIDVGGLFCKKSFLMKVYLKSNVLMSHGHAISHARNGGKCI